MGGNSSPSIPTPPYLFFPSFWGPMGTKEQSKVTWMAHHNWKVVLLVKKITRTPGHAQTMPKSPQYLPMLTTGCGVQEAALKKPVNVFLRSFTLFCSILHWLQASKKWHAFLGSLLLHRQICARKWQRLSDLNQKNLCSSSHLKRFSVWQSSTLFLTSKFIDKLYYITVILQIALLLGPPPLVHPKSFHPHVFFCHEFSYANNLKK
jgi:hypothetical protein